MSRSYRQNPNLNPSQISFTTPPRPSSNTFSQILVSSRHHQQQSPHGGNNPSVHPQFRSKSVCTLHCRHCETLVCKRGMKAILLGDTRVELYSTDAPPASVQLVEKDYMTRNCQCRIRDVACLSCGNVIGYHVTQPCEVCLDSCNNGHFWMFLSDGVLSKERGIFGDSSKKLLWAHLPCAENDFDPETRYELLCR